MRRVLLACALVAWTSSVAWAQDTVEARRLYLGTTGVTVTFFAGAADPSAGAGVAASVGSSYWRTSGQVWLKTGAGDTAWTLTSSSSSVTGSGTNTYLARFTGTYTLGNSNLIDDGVAVTTTLPVQLGASPAVGGQLRLSDSNAVSWKTTGVDYVGLRAASGAVNWGGGTVYPTSYELQAGAAGAKFTFDATAGGLYHATDPRLYLWSGTTGGSTGDGLLLEEAAGGGYLWQYENLPLFFGTNNLTRITIAANGTVTVAQNITLSGTGNSVGTVTSGTWNGSVIGVSYGGTGLSTFTAGGAIPYSTAATTLAALAIGGAGTFLRSNGTAPTWATMTIPDTIAQYSLLYASAANTLASTGGAMMFDGISLGIGPDTTPDYLLDVQGALHADGIASFGTDVVTGASAGDLVIPNARVIRGVNAAGSNAVSLIGLTSVNQVAVDPSGQGTTFGGDIVPTISDASDIGTSERLWANAWISTMNALVFNQQTQTITSGWFTVGHDAGDLGAAVGASDTTVNFGKAMTVGDFVLIRAHDTGGTVKAEYIQVGTLVGGTTYNVTRDLASAHGTDPAWAAGTPFLVRGQSGDGRIDLSVVSGTPRLIMAEQGVTYNAETDYTVVGDLNGYYGYGAKTWGIAFGNPAAANATIDATNGIRLRTGTTNRLALNADGSGSLATSAITWDTAGVLKAGSWTVSGNKLFSGAGASYVALDGLTGTIRMWAGNETAASAPWRVSEDGSFVATNATITGSATITSGSIGGWTIGSSYLEYAGGSGPGMSPADYPFFAGEPYTTRATAPFRVTAAGALFTSNVTINAGGVTLDNSGLFISPISGAGPAFANANAVRWTTDTTYRTAIWRADDSAGSAYRTLNIDHVGDDSEALVWATQATTTGTYDATNYALSERRAVVLAKSASEATVYEIARRYVSGTQQAGPYMALVNSATPTSTRAVIGVGTPPTGTTYSDGTGWGTLTAGIHAVGTDVIVIGRPYVANAAYFSGTKAAGTVHPLIGLNAGDKVLIDDDALGVVMDGTLNTTGAITTLDVITLDSPYSATPGSRSGLSITSGDGGSSWWAWGLNASGNLVLDDINGTAAEAVQVAVSDLTWTFPAAIKAAGLGSDTGTGLVVNGSGFIKVNSSSERYKQNIRRNWKPDNPLAILAVEPMLFDYKPSSRVRQCGPGDPKTCAATTIVEAGTPDVIGFSAEALAATKLPGLVNVNADGQPESIRDQALLAYLLRAMQAQQAEITQLRADVAKLKR